MQWVSVSVGLLLCGVVLAWVMTAVPSIVTRTSASLADSDPITGMLLALPTLGQLVYLNATWLRPPDVHPNEALDMFVDDPGPGDWKVLDDSPGRPHPMNQSLGDYIIKCAYSDKILGDNDSANSCTLPVEFPLCNVARPIIDPLQPVATRFSRVHSSFQLYNNATRNIGVSEHLYRRMSCHKADGRWPLLIEDTDYCKHLDSVPGTESDLQMLDTTQASDQKDGANYHFQVTGTNRYYNAVREPLTCGVKPYRLNGRLDYSDYAGSPTSVSLDSYVVSDRFWHINVVLLARNSVYVDSRLSIDAMHLCYSPNGAPVVVGYSQILEKDTLEPLYVVGGARHLQIFNMTNPVTAKKEAFIAFVSNCDSSEPALRLHVGRLLHGPATRWSGCVSHHQPTRLLVYDEVLSRPLTLSCEDYYAGPAKGAAHLCDRGCLNSRSLTVRRPSPAFDSDTQAGLTGRAIVIFMVMCDNAVMVLRAQIPLSTDTSESPLDFNGVTLQLKNPDPPPFFKFVNYNTNGEDMAGDAWWMSHEINRRVVVNTDEGERTMRIPYISYCYIENRQLLYDLDLMDIVKVPACRRYYLENPHTRVRSLHETGGLGVNGTLILTTEQEGIIAYNTTVNVTDVNGTSSFSKTRKFPKEPRVLHHTLDGMSGDPWAPMSDATTLISDNLRPNILYFYDNWNGLVRWIKVLTGYEGYEPPDDNSTVPERRNLISEVNTLFVPSTDQVIPSTFTGGHLAATNAKPTGAQYVLCGNYVGSKVNVFHNARDQCELYFTTRYLLRSPASEFLVVNDTLIWPEPFRGETLIGEIQKNQTHIIRVDGISSLRGVSGMSFNHVAYSSYQRRVYLSAPSLGNVATVSNEGEGSGLVFSNSKYFDVIGEARKALRPQKLYLDEATGVLYMTAAPAPILSSFNAIFENMTMSEAEARYLYMDEHYNSYGNVNFESKDGFVRDMYVERPPYPPVTWDANRTYTQPYNLASRLWIMMPRQDSKSLMEEPTTYYENPSAIITHMFGHQTLQYLYLVERTYRLNFSSRRPLYRIVRLPLVSVLHALTRARVTKLSADDAEVVLEWTETPIGTIYGLTEAATLQSRHISRVAGWVAVGLLITHIILVTALTLAPLVRSRRRRLQYGLNRSEGRRDVGVKV